MFELTQWCDAHVGDITKVDSVVTQEDREPSLLRVLVRLQVVFGSIFDASQIDNRNTVALNVVANIGNTVDKNRCTAADRGRDVGQLAIIDRPNNGQGHFRTTE